MQMIVREELLKEVFDISIIILRVHIFIVNCLGLLLFLTQISPLFLSSLSIRSRSLFLLFLNGVVEIDFVSVDDRVEEVVLVTHNIAFNRTVFSSFVMVVDVI